MPELAIPPPRSLSFLAARTLESSWPKAPTSNAAQAHNTHLAKEVERALHKPDIDKNQINKYKRIEINLFKNKVLTFTN